MSNVVFYAKGHHNVLCTHPTTIEFTKSKSLSPRGNCVAGVECTLAPEDLPKGIKELLSTSMGIGKLSIHAGKYEVIITGRGAEGLSFTNRNELVIRKSSFASDRTLMVAADQASSNLPRGMVSLLKNPETLIKLELSVVNST